MTCVRSCKRVHLHPSPSFFTSTAGGIRCERASALLNEMSAAIDDLNPKGVYHCRGGIERYVKTYQSGGYWQGKNYLFDKVSLKRPVGLTAFGTYRSSPLTRTTTEDGADAKPG